MYKSQQIKGTFSQRLDLSSYPFDTHRLVVTLLSPAYSRSEVELQWHVHPSDFGASGGSKAAELRNGLGRRPME